MTKNKISDYTTFFIDLYKENNRVIHLSARYDRFVDDEDIVYYIKKSLKPIIAKYFPKNITVIETSPIKFQSKIVVLDICIAIPTEMTTVQKRKWAYDKNGLVYQMFKDIDINMAKIIDKYEARQTKDWRCGDRLYENAV